LTKPTITPEPAVRAPSTRADLVRSILIWDRVAASAAKVAAELREQLARDARAEYAEQGTAPTWRLPDLATVTLPVSRQTVAVADQAALTAWMATRRPEQVQTVQQIRPAGLKALLGQICVVDGDLPTLDDGELVPGLTVRPGGQPRALTLRAAPEATAVLDAEADAVLGSIAAALGEPIGLEDPA
jgi:hypothetical protein